ncbi:phosphate propanoyltransferase [Robertmurraya massiliosenegalensis]|uniref:phosphate propanoyltransferase n=1 Tax=Robertmurraya massiliosenegalensis TaxID=1287657 RepID=UPI000304D183|nr:phosphate propanoyltransferase [Robertmurraya massiliosenegalensis]
MTNNRQIQEKIVKEVVKRVLALEEQPYVPIGVSNRHIHLKQDDLDVLFGKGYQLTKWKDLKQPGQFAAKETVSIIGKKGELERVRILGPVRNITQVEVSMTDSFKIGVPAPVKESGKIEGTPGVRLKGPCGEVEMTEGVIVALRHIHVPPQFAEKFQLKDKDLVDVELGGERKTIFKNVLIRISDKYVLEMHLDTDEANAAGVKNGDLGLIQKRLRC